jgi:hypothetical protein
MGDSIVLWGGNLNKKNRKQQKERRMEKKLKKEALTTIGKCSRVQFLLRRAFFFS